MGGRKTPHLLRASEGALEVEDRFDQLALTDHTHIQTLLATIPRSCNFTMQQIQLCISMVSNHHQVHHKPKNRSILKMP